jgi:hypothetical protein
MREKVMDGCFKNAVGPYAWCSFFWLSEHPESPSRLAYELLRERVLKTGREGSPWWLEVFRLQTHGVKTLAR